MEIQQKDHNSPMRSPIAAYATKKHVAKPRLRKHHPGGATHHKKDAFHPKTMSP